MAAASARMTTRSCIRLRGIVFDMDGTLLTSKIDFPRMRERLGVLGLSPGADVLSFVSSAPCVATRAQRESIIVEEEMLASVALMHDIPSLASWLRERSHLHTALLTRNNSVCAANAVAMLSASGVSFKAVVSREWDGPPKPAPDALLHLARTLEVEPHELVMVGDSSDDVECGRAAGAVSILIGGTDCPRAIAASDHRVPTLTALVALLDELGAAAGCS